MLDGRTDVHGQTNGHIFAKLLTKSPQTEDLQIFAREIQKFSCEQFPVFSHQRRGFANALPNRKVARIVHKHNFRFKGKTWQHCNLGPVPFHADTRQTPAAVSKAGSR
jgi:hypothetical protein